MTADEKKERNRTTGNDNQCQRSLFQNIKRVKMAKAKVWGAPVEEEMAKGVVAIQCPGCKEKHFIYTIKPTSNGAVWGFNGNYERPTFTPSLLIRTGKYVPGHEDFHDEGYNLSSICHSFITDGRIQFLGDCTHELKGQTVDLPEID